MSVNLAEKKFSIHSVFIALLLVSSMCIIFLISFKGLFIWGMHTFVTSAFSEIVIKKRARCVVQYRILNNKKLKLESKTFLLFLMMRIEEFIFNDKDAMKSFLLTLFFFLFLSFPLVGWRMYAFILMYSMYILS